MSLKSVILAIAYREYIFFKRFFSEYVVSWVIPLLFALAIVFLPTTIASSTAVTRRFSTVLGSGYSLQDILIYSICMSAVMSIVISIVSDLVQTLYHEYRTLGIMNVILESTSLTTYVTASAIVRSLMMGLLSTLYLIAVLPLIAGLKGLITYLILLPALLVSSLALGLYSMVLALPLTFYLRIDRPWTVTNTLAPALLAGAGLYIPIKLVPLILKVIAYTAPVPQMCEVVKVIALKGFSQSLLPIMAVITALATAYSAVITYLGKLSDVHARRGG